MDDTLRKFWEIEEIDQKRTLTKEEQACEKHYKETQAYKRLEALEKRFATNDTLKQLYSKFLIEYEQLGHMELAKPSNEISCYLPHQVVIKPSSMLELHRRLGHINYQDRCKLKSGAADGMDFTDNDGRKSIKNCKICAEGIMHRTSFPRGGNRANEPLEIIHSDLCGPMESISHGRAKYFLTFIDDYSDFCLFCNEARLYHSVCTGHVHMGLN